MIYFDFLKIYKKIEDLRLKNAKTISNSLQEIANSFLENIQKGLLKPFNILLISLYIIGFGVVIRSFLPFDHLQILRSEGLILTNQRGLMLGDFFNNLIVNIIDKYQLNHFLIAELLMIILGIVTCFISFKILKKSIFSYDRVGVGLIILAEVFGYFVALNFSDDAIFNFNKHYLISLFIVYSSLLASAINNKKIIYNFLLAFIGASLILLKWQNIFLVIFGEIFLIFFSKKSKNIADFFIRVIIISIITLSYLSFIFKGSVVDMIINDFTNWHFFSHKFLNHKIINEIYLNQNSRGYFWLLSQEIFLVFLLLFCYQQFLNSKISDGHDDRKYLNQLRLNFFWIIFFASLIMSLCENKIGYKVKEIFCLLNFPAIIYIFFNILFSKKIDFKRHGIVLAIIALIGIGDSKIFFEIFFYLPYFWFVFFIIFASKLRYKILKNKLIGKLNNSDKFFILYSKKSIFLFVVLVAIFLIIEFTVNFLLAWLIAVILILLMIIFCNKINQKIFFARKFHFLISIIFIVNFAYFFSFILANFRIYGNKNIYYFLKERQNVKSVLINEINVLSDIHDQTLIISSLSNSFYDISVFLKSRVTNYFEMPIVSNTSLSNKIFYNNIKKSINERNDVIVFNNSFIIGEYFCLISNFEQMMRFSDFKKILSDNYLFKKRIKIFHNFKNDFNFYNKESIDLGDDSKQFLIYDFEIFVRK